MLGRGLSPTSCMEHERYVGVLKNPMVHKEKKRRVTGFLERASRISSMLVLDVGNFLHGEGTDGVQVEERVIGLEMSEFFMNLEWSLALDEEQGNLLDEDPILKVGRSEFGWMRGRDVLPFCLSRVRR